MTFSDPLGSPGGMPEDRDIVIAVMGVTGVGKSTFIKTVSGRDDVVIGDSLFSGTQAALRSSSE
jgi:ABC-type branched-subunit amino acid transport system ATPase component